MIDSSQNIEYLCDLSSSEKSSYVYKQSQDINEFHDILKQQQQIGYCPTERVFSQGAKSNLEIVFEIHNGFNTMQISVIRKALQIVVDRLFKPEILHNMYQICNTSGCFLADGVWSHSNLQTDPVYKDEYLLLEYQLMCLRNKSENGELSTMNIYPSHRQNGEKNDQHSGCVSCIRHGSTFLIDGEFEIELNEDQLNQSRKTSSNVLSCAGNIVYELLHNLGHQCGDTFKAGQSQMNVFQKCFLHDGDYRPNT